MINDVQQKDNENNLYSDCRRYDRDGGRVGSRVIRVNGLINGQSTARSISREALIYDIIKRAAYFAALGLSSINLKKLNKNLPRGSE